MKLETTNKYRDMQFGQSLILYPVYQHILYAYTGEHWVEAPDELDYNEGCDLISSNGKRCAIRTRDFAYIQYSNDITIKVKNRSGYKCEFDKIFKGDLPMDYMLYGILNETKTTLASYYLINFPLFKVLFFNYYNINTFNNVAYTIKKNPHDGSTFIACHMHYFRHSIISSKKHQTDEDVGNQYLRELWKRSQNDKSV